MKPEKSKSYLPDLGKLKHEKRWTLLWILIVLLYLGSDLSAFSKGKQDQESKIDKYDLIIIPGIPFNGKSWNWIMKTRVQWAKHLYDQGITKKILFSGGAVYTPYCEAEIMALYAKAIGVPSEDIITETQAEHSVENVYNSYLLARSMGFEKIAIATDPFQTIFLRRFTKQNIDRSIVFLPIQYHKLDKSSIMIDPVIDCSKAYRENFVSIYKKETKRERLQKSRGVEIARLKKLNKGSKTGLIADNK